MQSDPWPHQRPHLDRFLSCTLDLELYLFQSWTQLTSDPVRYLSQTWFSWGSFLNLDVKEIPQELWTPLTWKLRSWDLHPGGLTYLPLHGPSWRAEPCILEDSPTSPSTGQRAAPAGAARYLPPEAVAGRGEGLLQFPLLTPPLLNGKLRHVTNC